MTDPASEKVWLVTEYSSGFGQLFIPAIIARGDKVIATARNVSSLSPHSDDENVRIMQLDVTASQEELNSKIHEALPLFDEIDVLVNNAGYLGRGV
jgi:NADP-dependent 3-hydroxy acid dehydrogenase YdfG